MVMAPAAPRTAARVQWNLQQLHFKASMTLVEKNVSYKADLELDIDLHHMIFYNNYSDRPILCYHDQVLVSL